MDGSMCCGTRTALKGERGVGKTPSRELGHPGVRFKRRQAHCYTCPMGTSTLLACPTRRRSTHAAVLLMPMLCSCRCCTYADDLFTPVLYPCQRSTNADAPLTPMLYQRRPTAHADALPMPMLYRRRCSTHADSLPTPMLFQRRPAHRRACPRLHAVQQRARSRKAGQPAVKLRKGAAQRAVQSRRVQRVEVGAADAKAVGRRWQRYARRHGTCRGGWGPGRARRYMCGSTLQSHSNWQFLEQDARLVHAYARLKAAPAGQTDGLVGGHLRGHEDGRSHGSMPHRLGRWTVT
mmetsp:Transcript_28818/g.85287  ORF Transcript_28818/g.85287 Transcript_28818/m.85287 type:complete len:292 (-) Transcript_28818:752-1627(-)